MTNQPKKAENRHKSAVLNNKKLPSYFLSLELENVLCFKERQEINLSDSNGHPAQWTVILGNNGVGKTTLLRCLAGMGIGFVHIDEENNSFANPLLFEFLNNPKSLWLWQEIGVLQDHGAKVKSYLISGNNLLEINKLKNIEFTRSNIEMFVEAGGYIGEGLGAGLGGLRGLICYGYGATRRMGKASLIDSHLSENSASLFSDDTLLLNAEEWLLQTDYAVKSSSGKIRSYFKKQFEQIVEILKRILPDVDDIRIAPVDEDRNRPTAEFLTPYGWVQLSSLGLGYRTTIAWMVDLAVRLFKRYPDSEDPLAEPAIVLVDEIDLHMHPKWQRTIMEFLTQRFPNTQFIVTAHSPLVVQAAQDANIVLLRREGDRVVIDNNPEIIDNWRVDQVLTSVFEIPSARPPQIEKLLAERQEILSKPKISKADKAKLKELEEKIGSLPTAETPDDIKAMDIIRRAAKLLEKSDAEAVE